MKSDLVISDIMTKEAIFFEDKEEQKLAKFCEIRDID
jgi:hypothetical protein